MSKARRTWAALTLGGAIAAALSTAFAQGPLSPPSGPTTHGPRTGVPTIPMSPKVPAGETPPGASAPSTGPGSGYKSPGTTPSSALGASVLSPPVSSVAIPLSPPQAMLPGASPPAAGIIAPGRGVSLRRCLELAELNHPQIWASRARLRAMRAQLDEAHFAPFSEFTATGGLGLAPTIRGNNIYSPNTEISLSGSMGAFWRIGVEGVIPLWTFGKITNLWNAAEAQIKVGEGDVNKQKNLVKLDVRRAFFGLQLARDAMSLLGEAAEKLDQALEHLEKEVKAGNGDEIDLFKLRTFRFELDGRRSEAQRYQAIALASLRFLTGEGEGFDIPPAPLRAAKRSIGPVAQYLQAARIHRPEVNMLRAGLMAREAQVALARSKYMPDIGLVLGASWSRAPLVTDQLNPYIRDDANFLRYGAMLGVRWQLDLLPDSARVEQAQAAVEELRATERYALGGIGVEVETAYAQVVDALARERAYGAAQRTARQWVIAIQQGIDVGTKEDADLVDAAKQWALQRYNHLNATMDLNVAWSNLALTTAWDDVAPEE